MGKYIEHPDAEIKRYLNELIGCFSDTQAPFILKRLLSVTPVDYRRWQETDQAPYSLTLGTSDKYIQAINLARDQGLFAKGNIFLTLQDHINLLFSTADAHPRDETIFAYAQSSEIAQSSIAYLKKVNMGIDRAAVFSILYLLEVLSLPPEFRNHAMTNIIKGDEINIATLIILSEAIRQTTIRLLQSQA